jgi:hypothetical protein
MGWEYVKDAPRTAQAPDFTAHFKTEKVCDEYPFAWVKTLTGAIVYTLIQYPLFAAKPLG